jgi:hypothetical protein
MRNYIMFIVVMFSLGGVLGSQMLLRREAIVTWLQVMELWAGHQVEHKRLRLLLKQMNFVSHRARNWKPFRHPTLEMVALAKFRQLKFHLGA